MSAAAASLRALRASRSQGDEDVARYRDAPASLPGLRLARFEEAPLVEQAVVRTLVALRPPLRLLAAVHAHLARARRPLESYAYWAGVRRSASGDTFRRLTRGTTILLYHAVGGAQERRGRFVVPADLFERQMRRVARRPVIGLEELVACRREHRLPPAGAVLLTFDDGYEDMLTRAAPVLRLHGLSATVFLVSSRIGGVNDWDRGGGLEGRKLLDPEQVRELRAQGVEIGAHGRTHRVLPELPPAERADEIAGAREELAATLGVQAATFAYPHGKLDGETVEMVRAAGYGAACGVQPGRNGPATPPHALRRVLVSGHHSPFAFAWALAVGDPDGGARLRRLLLRRR